MWNWIGVEEMFAAVARKLVKEGQKPESNESLHTVSVAKNGSKDDSCC